MPNMSVAADRDQTSRVDAGITNYCLRALMTAIALPKPSIMFASQRQTPPEELQTKHHTD